MSFLFYHCFPSISRVDRGKTMSRRVRAAKNCTIKPWLSARTDSTEGRFIQVGNSLLLSHKATDSQEGNSFLSLTANARLLYLAMCMEAAEKRQFEFPKRAAEKYGFSESTFRRCVKELMQNGFIVVNSGRTTREPNIYQFVNDWKTEPKRKSFSFPVSGEPP